MAYSYKLEVRVTYVIKNATFALFNREAERIIEHSTSNLLQRKLNLENEIPHVIE